MDKLLKIKEVSTKYNITKRTLRYYEEIGILSTIRKDGSNYRYYDNDALSRLEQIFLLKSLNFQISEISQILLSHDDKFIDDILNDKLIKLHQEIDTLFAYKKIISSIIKIKQQQGAKNINFYQIIREQIYIHKNVERKIEMNQYVGDMIIIEFGINIVPCGNELIENIKKLRKDIEGITKKEIPLIRIKDNTNLKNDEYRILIKNVIIANETFENVENNEKVIKIVNALKKSINANIDSITAQY